MIPVLSSPVQSLGPLVKCNDTGYALVKDPSYYHGIMNDTGIVLRKDDRYNPPGGHSNTPYSNCNPMHVIGGEFSGQVEGGKYEWYRDWETDRKSTRLNSSHRL